MASMNLLFSMADQLRWDALSPTTPSLQTPNLAALATEGILFSKAYSSTPTCTPARAAILTGRSPWNHGMLGYGVVALRYPFEFPRALAEAGYKTAVIGKDHFGWDNETGGAAFAHDYGQWIIYDGILTEEDTYHQWFNRTAPNMTLPQECWPTLDMNSWMGAAYACDEALHPTAWVGRQASAFIEAHAGSGTGGTPPFLLKVSFHRPHSPYDPPQRVLDRLRASDIPLPVRPKGGWSEGFRFCDARASPDAWCGEQEASAEAMSRLAYHASVAFVDEQIGAIHAALRRSNLLESTLWLFTSDHGDAQGDHWHWRKGYPYEFSAHVPMVLRWPRDVWPAALPPIQLRRGATLKQLVEMRDIAPTLLHAAGALSSVAAQAMDGDSLLCLLAGSVTPTAPACPTSWRVLLGLEHNICYNVTNHWSAITDGTTK
jgi:arylsulfatase